MTSIVSRCGFGKRHETRCSIRSRSSGTSILCVAVNRLCSLKVSSGSGISRRNFFSNAASCTGLSWDKSTDEGSRSIAAEDRRKLRAVHKYRRARNAKLALSGHGPWENEFKVLNDSDIRAIEEDDPDSAAQQRKRKQVGSDKIVPAEGRRTISWIWRASDLQGTEGRQ